MPRKTAKKRSASARARSKAAEKVRLQRLLASAGFGSRRQCEELIEAGRVDVDGKVVTKLGTTVDPESQKVRVDGVPLKKQKLVYYAVNKPTGFVTTNRDPQGRPRVIDLVPPDERVFPVGRLDRSSEGLILLTNDGELAQKLTHPKFGVRKVYRVTVAGKVDGETMKKMRQGIYIAEGFVKVEGARILKSRSRATEMEIVLREGKNREIRRILARLGHKVQHLRRIAVGPLRLGDLPAGAHRVVNSREIEKLWLATEASSSDEPEGRRSGTKKKRRSAKGKSPSNSGRRPTKKSRKPPRKKAEEFPFSLGESTTSGVVIGGDPNSEDVVTETDSRSSGTGRRSKKTASRGSDRGSSGGRRKSSKGQSSKGKRAGKRSTRAGTSKQRPGGKKRVARKGSATGRSAKRGPAKKGTAGKASKSKRPSGKSGGRGNSKRHR